MKKITIILCALWLTGCAAGQKDAQVLVLHTVRSDFLGLDPEYFTYYITSDGNGETSVRVPSGLGREPVWSPDGRWIAFTDEERERNVVLHLMRSDGTQHRQYQPTRMRNYPITWAPDGKSIAYDGSWPEFGIYTLNVECLLRGETCQPKPMFLGDGTFPDWSPNGRQIAYNSPNFRGISVIAADGTGQAVPLVLGIEPCGFPRWSPDGEKIAFSCDEVIYTANKDGTELTKITGPGYSPQWSPNGREISFISGRGDSLGRCVYGPCGSGGIYSSAVFLMGADGSNVRRLSLRNDERVMWHSWLLSKDKPLNP